MSNPISFIYSKFEYVQSFIYTSIYTSINNIYNIVVNSTMYTFVYNNIVNIYKKDDPPNMEEIPLKDIANE